MAKVLLVVNDVPAAHQLRRALHRSGHEVALEYDGRIASALVKRQAVDCIICDPVLPGAFGTDLLVAARAALQRPDLPGILLRPLPPLLRYELLDAEPVRVLDGTYSADELVSALQEMGLAPSRQERRRAANVPSRSHGRRSTDPKPAHHFSESSKE